MLASAATAAAAARRPLCCAPCCPMRATGQVRVRARPRLPAAVWFACPAGGLQLSVGRARPAGAAATAAAAPPPLRCSQLAAACCPRLPPSALPTVATPPTARRGRDHHRVCGARVGHRGAAGGWVGGRVGCHAGEPAGLGWSVRALWARGAQRQEALQPGVLGSCPGRRAGRPGLGGSRGRAQGWSERWALAAWRLPQATTRRSRARGRRWWCPTSAPTRRWRTWRSSGCRRSRRGRRAGRRAGGRRQALGWRPASVASAAGRHCSCLSTPACSCPPGPAAAPSLPAHPPPPRAQCADLVGGSLLLLQRCAGMLKSGLPFPGARRRRARGAAAGQGPLVPGRVPRSMPSMRTHSALRHLNPAPPRAFPPPAPARPQRSGASCSTSSNWPSCGRACWTPRRSRPAAWPPWRPCWAAGAAAASARRVRCAAAELGWSLGLWGGCLMCSQACPTCPRRSGRPFCHPRHASLTRRHTCHTRRLTCRSRPLPPLPQTGAALFPTGGSSWSCWARAWCAPMAAA